MYYEDRPRNTVYITSHFGTINNNEYYIHNIHHLILFPSRDPTEKPKLRINSSDANYSARSKSRTETIL